MDKQEKNKEYVILLLFVFLLIAVVFLVLRSSFLTNQISLVKQRSEQANSKVQDNQYISPIEMATDPVKGNPEAKNKLFIYSSFSCLHCASFRLEINKLLEKKPNDFKIIWKDAISISDDKGKSSAVAARCAQAQGKFWEYHDLLFSNPDKFTAVDFIGYAQQLNLDVSSFGACLESREILSLIQSGQNEAIAVGVDGTPFTVFNDQRLSGFYSYQDLIELLNK
jgi:protein-disulfide isomerase